MELTEGKVGISREPSGTPTPPPLRSVLGPEVEVVAVVAVGPGGGEAARQRGHERDDHSKLAMGCSLRCPRETMDGCPPRPPRLNPKRCQPDLTPTLTQGGMFASELPA